MVLKMMYEETSQSHFKKTSILTSLASPSFVRLTVSENVKHKRGFPGRLDLS